MKIPPFIRRWLYRLSGADTQMALLYHNKIAAQANAVMDFPGLVYQIKVDRHPKPSITDKLHRQIAEEIATHERL